MNRSMQRVLGACALLAMLALAHAAHQTTTHGHVQYDSSKEHSSSSSGGWFSGFRNALADMNPFGHRLGPDASETHNRVETIYEDMHRQAQQRVNELREEAAHRSYNELQAKIADIYADAAAEAEQRIERLKRPLFGAMWRSHEDTESTDEESAYQRYLSLAKTKVNDASDAVKAKWRGKPAHETTHMFDETSKYISDAYKSAIAKAKEAAGKVEPVTGEAWHDTKARAHKLYQDMFQATRHETRPRLVQLRDALKNGLFKAGGMMASAAVKTWHLALHLMLGSVWMVVGAALATVAKMQWDKYLFRRQLAAPHTGPVVLQKEFYVVGATDMQKKFNDYWSNTAANFIKAQPGCKKMVFSRGIDMGSNVYTVATEFATVEDLRRMLDSPEMAEVKKRMPKATLSRHTLAHVVTQVKGTAHTAADEGERGAPEGLRHRNLAAQ